MSAIQALVVTVFGVTFLGVPAANATGALAVGACGAYGSSWDSANEMLAQGAALTNCPDSKCQIYVTVRRACAALAYDPNTCAWGATSRSTLGEARQSAIASCRGYGGENCVLRTSFCDKSGDQD